MSDALLPSCDRKTRFRTSQKNTFGLMPGPNGTCPGATVGEGGCSCIPPGRKLPTCYVFRIMSAYKNVASTLQHNTSLLKSSAFNQQMSALEQEFSRFEQTEKKQTAPQLFYRLHWSGDIFDRQYAAALAGAMAKYPDIRFWNYTRSFDLVRDLVAATPNLTQYLSLDAINMASGLDVYFGWVNAGRPGGILAICYMGKTNDFAQRYAELRESRGWPELPPVLTACPADSGAIPVDGACAKCQKCIKGKNIWFES